MKLNRSRTVAAFRSRKVRQCQFTTYKILYFIVIEFHDLWHSLKVPNDVDLLRQLASGKLRLRLHHLCSSFSRGSAGYCGGDCGAESTNDEKEGQKRGCSSPTSSSDHEYTSEGRDRSSERLRCSPKHQPALGSYTFPYIIIHDMYKELFNTNITRSLLFRDVQLAFRPGQYILKVPHLLG